MSVCPSRRRSGLRRVVTVGAVLAASVAGALAAIAPSGAATGYCSVPAGSGLVKNQWQGPSGVGDEGAWWDPGNWSLGVTPDAGTNQLVCIDTAGSVVMPAYPDPQSGIEAHVAALDLASGSTLEVRLGNRLFVDGAPSVVRSRLRKDSTLLVEGAYFGGAGAADLSGTLLWRATDASAASFSTRRPEAYGTRLGPNARRGLLRVQPSGLLAVDGRGVNLNDEYRLVVQGVMELTGQGFVAADHGTSLQLQPWPDGTQVGRLLIRNDGGWLEGDDLYPEDAMPLSSVGGDGLVLKSDPTDRARGTSAITASFPTGTPSVGVYDGTVSLPDGVVVSQPADVGAGQTFGSGRCDPALDVLAQGYDCKAVAIPGDPQLAAVRVPAADADGATLTLSEDATTGLSRVFKVDALGMAATRARPAVLNLRYDSAVRAGRSPGQVDVFRKHGTQPWSGALPTCTTTNRVPAGAVACVDRDGTDRSRVLSGGASQGDLLMVVRTTELSRWVAR